MKAKVKVIALSVDTANCGTEVEIYQHEQEFFNRLAGIMEERIAEYPTHPKAEEIKRLIAEGSVVAAWDIWRDTLMPDMDVYVWEEEEIEVEIPAALNRVLVEVQGGVVQAVYADHVNTSAFLLDHDTGDCGDEREEENKKLAEMIPSLQPVHIYNKMPS